MGYFNKIYKSDVFVFLDDVQLPQGRSVATRNKIKSSTGEEMLIIVPVKSQKGALPNYNQVEIDYSQKWQVKTSKTIANYYRKAPHFNEVYEFVDSYLMTTFENLAEMNVHFIRTICGKLNIHTDLQFSSALNITETRNDRIISICKHFGADIYLSGQGARKYNDPEAYARENISIQYQEFIQPGYPQINGNFIPNLSVIDGLFNTGFLGTEELVKTKAAVAE
jgi:hypothetical protein